MNNIVLHIPHSSLKYPEVFQKVANNNNEIMDKANLQMCDMYTDELFSSDLCEKVVFDYSRIFCDVERFVDDEKEIMSKFGMGYVYTHTIDKKRFFSPSDDYKKMVYEEYYKPFHVKLDRVISRCIAKGKTILIDCHSFSKKIIMDKDKLKNLPDICVGFDEKYKNERLIKYICDYFTNCGYSIDRNYPYLGTMIPDMYFNQNVDGLNCVMIEINRNLYINDDYSKNGNFENLKCQINKLLVELSNLEL